MKFETDPKKFKQVLTLASKPSWDEFSRVALVTLAGVTGIGLIGFFIFQIMEFVPG